MQFSSHLKLTKLSSIIISLLSTNYAFSAVVRTDIDYQTYRDFGENKGQFTPGATNLPIYDKSGNLVGTLNKAPMPDFSAASKDGVGTLVAPQYAASVKHNTGYSSLHFGGAGENPDYLRHTYQMVDRNNHTTLDYHLPRYSKYVTEVVPTETTTAGIGAGTYMDQDRFPVFYRTGSGTQYLRDKDWNVTWLAYPYDYLIGGTIGLLYLHPYQNEIRAQGGRLYDEGTGPLATTAGSGDSGSPLFAWDTLLNKWVLVGQQMGGMAQNGTYENSHTNWVIHQATFNQGHFDEDQADDVTNTDNLVWSLLNDGKTSTFKQDNGSSWSLAVKDTTADDSNQGGYNAAMNAGKNVRLTGNGGEILLKDSMHQGAGGLTFSNNYTVKAENGQTWVGAGVIVDEDKQVTWQINGVNDDFLHKLGKGTLLIQASGKNLGSLSAGDGITILDQQADAQGEKQAFDTVRLASGRPTVVLNSSDQVNPDNIYFGFRGGRLDLNGNSLSFERIHNADNGAQIVNHNAEKTANINVVGDTQVTIHSWGQPNRTGTIGSIYEYPRNGHTQYFRLKTSQYWYFPNATSNDQWEYLGTDRDHAIDSYLTSKNQSGYYQGILGETDPSKVNGALNFTYTPPTDKALYTLSGGSQLNGEIKVDKGTLLLSGYPTLHAEDIVSDKWGNLTRKEVIIDNDWVTSDFKANRFTATNGATLQLGNYANIEGDIYAENNSKVSLGYSKGENQWDNSWKCTRRDYNGGVSCTQDALSDDAYNALPAAQIQGNITLADNASLNLGKTNFIGNINGADNSHTRLRSDAQWTMLSDSQLGNLTTDQGSVITLNGNSATNAFNTLTINGDLTGNGRFDLNASLADKLSDKIVVNGKAEGNYLLAVENNDKDYYKPINILPLLILNNADQDWSKVKATLQNGHIDLGAYRYNLVNKANSFALYTALLPDNPVVEEPVMDSAINDEVKPEYPLEFTTDSAIEPEKPTLDPNTVIPENDSVEQPSPPSPTTENEEIVETPVDVVPTPTPTPIDTVVDVTPTPVPDVTPTPSDTPAEVIPVVTDSENVLPTQNDSNTNITPTVVENTQPVIQRDWISQNANTGLSEQMAKINVLNKQQDLLNDYLRRLAVKESGVWVNLDQEGTRYQSNDYRQYKQELYTQQVGADKAISLKDSDLLLGGAFSHTNAHNQFAENQRGRTQDHAVSLYGKWILDNQFYVNTVVSYHHLSSKLSQQKDKIRQNAWTTSVGVGKRFTFDTIGIQPSFELTHYHLSAADYKVNNTNIRVPTLNFWQTRSGVMLDKLFGSSQINPQGNVKIFTALYYVHNLQRHQTAYVNQSRFNNHLFSNRLESQLGVSFRLGGAVDVTVKAGYANGDQISSQFNGGLELKYLW